MKTINLSLRRFRVPMGLIPLSWVLLTALSFAVPLNAQNGVGGEGGVSTAASEPARHHKKAKSEVVIPRKCIRSTSLTDKTECRGPDMDHLLCTKTKMDLVPNCGELNVNPN